MDVLVNLGYVEYIPSSVKFKDNSSGLYPQVTGLGNQALLENGFI